MAERKYYSDRVTVWYVSPSPDDELMVHEVTLEPVNREFESVDFDTVAWCPDQASADMIRAALNASLSKGV